MSDVIKYSIVIKNGTHHLAESDSGTLVLVDDYAALQQKLDAVLAENARMLSDYRDIPEMKRIGAPLTPATDAILNTVRAEGVDMLVADKVFEWMDSYREDAHKFANQLRAGSTEGGV